MRVAVIGIRTIGNVVKDEYTVYNFIKKIEEDMEKNCYSLWVNSNYEILISKENFKIVLL